MAKRGARTFAELTTDVVRSFLRSAVVVDDDLRMEGPRARPAPAEVAPAASDPTLEGAPPVVVPRAVELAKADRGRLDARTLINGFADRGIVCAAIVPEVGSDSSRLIAVAKSADLVILDWDVNNDGGRGAAQTVAALRAADGLRLIAIYTKDPGIDGIVARLRETVDTNTSFDDNRAEVGGLRLVVLLKPEAGVRNEPMASWVVAPEDLPERLIMEFSSVAGGLLANTALLGLATVRAKTPAVLAALDRSLDPGYLVHRFLLDEPGDAEDHAMMLVGSELAAVLGDAAIDDTVGMEAIRAWFMDRPYAQPDYPISRWQGIFSAGPSTTRSEGMLETLTKGLDNVAFGAVTRRYLKNTADLFDSDHESGASSNDRFAHLMSMRSIYRARPHTLTFGTILASDGEWFISIQPDCDAIRLPIDQPVAFPLVPLQASTGGERVDLVVDDNGTTRKFKLPSRFRDLRMVGFDADSQQRQVLEAQVDDEWRFQSEQGSFRWIGQLRESSALRLAKRYADGLSRIGLDESEWLRRARRASDEPDGEV